MRGLPNTSTHQLTSVIFGNWLILRCVTIGVGDCEANQLSWHEALWFMNVHLEAPLLMHTSVQPLSGVCTAVCGAALSPPGNERWAPA